MAEAKKTDKTAKKSQNDQNLKSTKQNADVQTDASNAKLPVSKVKQPLSKLAKAGKRSAKSVKEAEEKIVKEQRKKTASETIQKPKTEQKPPRSRSERAGKKYRESIKQIDKAKTYNLAEAVDLATRTSTASFDATIEMHINLAVDPKSADQNVRGTLVMPHGTGKALRVAVFAEDDEAKKAKKAGADIVGSDDLLESLEKERIDFDILITSPALMARLGKYAKLLGPKGLMPNPKSGTVTSDVLKAVQEAKAGRLEYRVDQAGIVHIAIGKTSFGPQKLLENAQAAVANIKAAKPASVKGAYIKSAYVTATMGPSIKAEL